MIAYASSMVREINAAADRSNLPLHPYDWKQLTGSAKFSIELVGARSSEKWTSKERKALDDAIAAIEVFRNE